MDPISMARSAFDILSKLKEELKAAEEAFEEARDFRQQIESLEIIVMMIPNNDKQNKEKNIKVETKSDSNAKKMVAYGKQKLERSLLEMTGLDQIVDVIKSTLQSGDDVEPLYSQGEIRPAEVLRSMKSCAEFSKLDVMFQGMSFIVCDAIRTIDNGTVTLREMQDIGPPKWWWKCLMPWNMERIMELKGNLGMHKINLSKQIESLQAAIGVASYTVQLEQLESVLDATSAFRHTDMKMMWKKKIGSDKTRVLINDFFEAFMSYIECESMNNKDLQEMLSKTSSREKIDNKMVVNVAHLRFINYIFNENNDENLSVFEANNRLCLFGDRAPRHASLPFVFDFILKQEQCFIEKVKFTLLRLTKKELDNTEEADMIPERADRKEIVKVRPFHRALILCELPVFDLEAHEFDCVTLLKFISPRNPTDKKQPKSKFSILSECPTMRCFVSKKSSNIKFNGEDDKYGNTSYKKIPSSVAKKLGVPIENWSGFSYKNTITKKLTAKAEMEGENEDTNYGILPLKTGCRLLYTPIVVKAGFYSPRYCLSTAAIDAEGFGQHFVRQYNKSMKSFVADYSTKETNINITDGSQLQSVSDERLGPLVECTDVVEIVFGLCRDLETYTTDEKGGGEDEYEVERNEDWIPYLSETFPYLPQRVLTFPSSEFPSSDDDDDNRYGIPEEIAIFINFPKKKKSSEKISVALDNDDTINESSEKTEVGCKSFGIFAVSKSENEPTTFELLPNCQYPLDDLKKVGDYGSHIIISLKEIIYKHQEQDNESKSYIICFIKDIDKAEPLINKEMTNCFCEFPYLEFNLDDDAIISPDSSDDDSMSSDIHNTPEEESVVDPESDSYMIAAVDIHPLYLSSDRRKERQPNCGVCRDESKQSMACCKVCDFDICQTCIEVSLYGGGHRICDTQASLISCPTCDVSECSGMEASWFYSSFQCMECHACGVCCAKYGSKCTVAFEVEPFTSTHRIDDESASICSKCESEIKVRGSCKDCELCSLCCMRAPVCLRLLSTSGRIPIGATVELVDKDEEDGRDVLGSGRKGILLHDDSEDVNGMPYKVVCPENDEVAWYYAAEIVISGSSTLTCVKDDQEGKTQDEGRDEVSLRADRLGSEVSENDDQAEGKANAGEESESGDSNKTDRQGAERLIMSSARVHPTS